MLSQYYDLSCSVENHSVAKLFPLRFHKLVWGPHGMESSSSSSGLLIGGSDNGVISIYDPTKILSGDIDDCLVFQSTKHTGTIPKLLQVKVNFFLIFLYESILSCQKK